MKSARYLGGEVFAAVLPLLMFGVALFFAQGDRWWPSVVELVAEGVLMPPAVILCFAIHRRVGRFVAPRPRVAAERAVMVFTIVIVLLFAFSVQPEVVVQPEAVAGTSEMPAERPHSEATYAWFNTVAYALVILFSVIVDQAPSKEAVA